MNRKNEKGFALVLSLVLLLVMSLMGGSLILISSGDHQSNNTSDSFQQTFYVAETALYQGEKYVLNLAEGPWKANGRDRDKSRAGLPINAWKKGTWEGEMEKKNYDNSDVNFLKLSSNICYNSFPDLDRAKLKKDGIVGAESWNFGKLLRSSFNTNASDEEKKEAEDLQAYFFEYFVIRLGDATYRGMGSSIKKKQQQSGKNGMAYRVYGCGINSSVKRMVVALESTIILPK